MKMMSVILVVMGMSLLLTVVVTAGETTNHYTKNLLSPFYLSEMQQDTDYEYTLDFHPPDRVGSVHSAIINFQLWLNPTITFNLLVDGQTCNTPSYTVHTTYASAGEGNIFFDCSNVITEAGTYTITLTPDDDTGAITGWTDIAYSNEPRGEANVHGTEYVVGEPAKIWLQLINASGDYINEGVCYTDVYSPDNQEYIERALMTSMNHDGIYYYDLTAPFQGGVYPVIAQCYYEATTTTEVFDSYDIYEGDYDGGLISDTWLDNTDEFKIKTDDVIYPFKRIDVNFTSSDYYDTCGGIDEILMSGISFLWKGKWDTGTANHDVNIYVWNYTSGDWLQLTNKIIGGLGGTIQTVTNTIETNNITDALGITATNEMKIRVFDTAIDEGTTSLKSHYMYAGCDQLSNPEWQEVKGSSEMHVTATDEKGRVAYWRTEVINGVIENSTWTGNFTYNFNIQSLTALNRTEEIYINLPTPFPCHHYLSGEVEGTPIDLVRLSNPLNPLSAGCQVTFNLELESGKNYDASVVFENWFKEEEQNWIAQSQIQYDVLRVACQNYQISANLTNYTIPATSYLDYSQEDTLWRSCQQYLDQYYHFNHSYFEEFQTVAGTFTADDMAYLDNQWTHLLETKDNLDTLAKSVGMALGLTADYSVTILADPNNLTSTIWSQLYSSISTSYLNYIKPSDVNSTEIAEEVWNYNGTINSNILSQFASSVWSYTTRTLSSFGTLVTDIWSAPSRNLTYYPTSTDQTNYTLIQEIVTDYGNNNTDLTNYTLVQQLVNDYGNQLTAQIIWEYTTRNLTYYPETTDETNYTLIENLIALYENNITAQEIWEYSDRNLTYFPAQIDLTNYTQIQNLISQYGNDLTAGLIWSYATRNLTYYPTQTDLTNYTQIQDIVTQYGNDDSTNYTLMQNLITNYGNDLTAELIWNYATRNLTYYPAQTDLTNYTQIQDLIQTYGNDDNTNYTLIQNLVSQYGNDLTAELVWSYSNRTLTDYNQTEQLDLTNYTLIGDLVTTLGNDDTTNYTLVGDLVSQYGNDLTADIVWNFVSRNLTYYPAQTDLTNYTLVQDLITQYGNEDTVNYTLVQELITDYGNTNTDLTNYTLVQDLISQYGNDLTAELVWNYGSKNLTYTEDVTNYSMVGDLVAQYGNDDSTNYTLIQDLISLYGNDLTAGLVWSYSVRNLTYYPTQTDLTNYTLVQEIVTTYGNDDVTNYTMIGDLITALGNNNSDLTNYTLIGDLITALGNNNTDLTNYTEIQNLVTLYGNEDTANYTLIQELITDYGNINTDLTNYTLVQDLITQYGNEDTTNYTLIGNLITALGNNNTDLVNYTYIADLITQLGNEDSTNYTLVQDIVVTYGNDDNTNYTLIGDLISQYSNSLSAQEVWEYSNRNLTTYLDVTNYTLVQELITAYGNDDTTNYTLVSDMVWSATERTLSSFNFTVDVNQTLIANSVWSAVNRSLTEAQDVTNYTLIAQLINSQSNNLTAQEVWEYGGGRNLTYYPSTTDETNYTLIQELITDYGNNDNTNYTYIAELIAQYGNNLTAEQIWQFNNRTLSSFDFIVEAEVNTSLIAGEVWDYFNRTLTQEFLDQTNYTLIGDLITEASNNLSASEIWNFQSRNLTYTEFQDLTNYSLVQEIVTNYGNNLTPEQIWEFENRTLSQFNFTVDAEVNASLLAQNVWEYFNRTLTQDFPDLTNYTQIEALIQAYANNITPEDVWNATTRTLTFTPDMTNYTWIQSIVQQYGNDDTTNYNLIQDLTWNATTRELTYYPTTNISLTNESIQAIGDAVWSYEGNISSNILEQVSESVQCYVNNLLEVTNEEWAVNILDC